MLRMLWIWLALSLLGACSWQEQVATYTDPDNGHSISISLESAHPTLAEYERTLILRKLSGEETSVKLTLDTGGYTAANLYACGPGTYMLDSYSEFVIVDTNTGIAKQGKCSGKASYVGVFDFNGNEPWSFIPGSKRPEEALVLRGG